MTRIQLRACFLTLLCCAACIPAHAQVRYRLTRILVDGPTDQLLFAGDLSNRGQVVGSSEFAFAWRDGVAINLGPLIDPTSPFTDATGNNNRSDIVGTFFDSQLGTFVGFLLRPGEDVVRVEGLPGAITIFVQDINNRRQIVANSVDAAGLSRPFVWERGDVMQLPALPGATSSDVVEINDRGVAVGTSGLEAPRAVTWEDAEVLDLGIPNSTGMDLNNRGQVIGWVLIEAGNRSFLWERGQVVELPALAGDVVASEAFSINNAGEIVGRTFFENALVATLWGNGEPVNLNDLIHSSDPLRPFVTLEFATLINDRSEIVASGRDSRAPNLNRLYFLTPIR